MFIPDSHPCKTEDRTLAERVLFHFSFQSGKKLKHLPTLHAHNSKRINGKYTAAKVRQFYNQHIPKQCYQGPSHQSQDTIQMIIIW